LIRAGELVPQGVFAEAQAAFLDVDAAATEDLAQALERHAVGVVAHFYMDVELQGVLSACRWPHIKISDSLKMADEAIAMAEAGMRTIIVLGVDFMSENVRAMLDASGHSDVEVYRVAADPIGCSLAEAARKLEYGAYLTRASQVPRSLHIIYINTSLDVKARAHHLVPTITCTSSNVVQTVLQAASQVPDLSIWFGPDTYMGDNLRQLFEGLSALDDDAIRALHPSHDRESIRSLLTRFSYFKQGTCIVHHMFGAEVVDTVRASYNDAFITAHLEVPGEMFQLALGAQRWGRGVVGSTSNILAFIAEQVEAAASEGEHGRLRFVLGTEAGMITAIVRKVQRILAETGGDIEAEIIFPVASEAITQTDDPQLAIVPGVAGGEGCSTAGGCATCPYMKMNSLDALSDLLAKLGSAAEGDLDVFHPRQYAETIAGRTTADLGSEPILHMRALQRHGELPAALIDDVMTRLRLEQGPRRELRT
jgi:quinolinate synthase